MGNTKRGINCPNCGGSVKFNGSVGYCDYCGASVENENAFEYTHTYIKRDEARIKEIEEREKEREFERKERKLAREKEELEVKNKIKLFGIFGVVILVMILVIVGASTESREKEEKRIHNAIAEGKISAGDYDDYMGENYKSVVKQFKAMGFTNIKTIDAGTAGLTFWKNGKVKRITINGKDDFDEKDYFAKDAKVIITYH